MTRPDQPNIVMIVSDEERRTDWLDGMADLPAHDRLGADGLTFNRHYTHSSPCSPSRASLFTGRYLPQHGVVDNVNFPEHTALDPAIPTVGSLLRGVGYEAAYVGKWHLDLGPFPDLEAHGYSGWQGSDHHYVGGPWTGLHFDPIIAAQAVDWLEHEAPRLDQPWCLTVALVNPHDVMWYPADQPAYAADHPDDARLLAMIKDIRCGDVDLEPFRGEYPERFDRLPDNFDDDLHTKPEIQRMWRWVRNREHFVGSMDLDEPRQWLRQLDYYAWLHERLDESLATVLGALDRLGIYDDTAIVYTSDHGDACGSHGLRAKLPCVYEEVLGVPLVVKVPGVTEAGATTDALSTHVDLAATVCALGGVGERGGGPAPERTLAGADMAPTLADPTVSVRDHVLFAQDSAQSPLLRGCRYAVRGFFDGDTKYARYYGIGGGVQRDGTTDDAGKVVPVDAPFDDQDHELYDCGDDPGELVNRANDRSRRRELREQFDRLLEYEAREFAPLD